MNKPTGIEWTDATWNPIRGCSRVSEGCRNCYAETVARRFNGPGQPYEGLIARGGQWNGQVRLVPEKLDEPLRWRKPRKVFCNSMSDVFHENVPDEFIDSIFAAMALAPHHTFQVLTKRPERMFRYMTDERVAFRVLVAMDCLAVDFEMAGIREKWLSVPDFPGYFVSNHGNVSSSHGAEHALLSLRGHPQGYRSVSLRREGRTHEHLVHRLVLRAFVREPREREEARHRNGNKADNRIANLSWGTKAENMQDSARHGTAGVWMKGRTTLDAATVEAIRERRKAGALLKDLEDEYGIDKRRISAIANGKIYKAAQLAWPLPSVWLGVSVEDQATADERIPLLLRTPAAVRWVSAEPLLGEVDITQWLWPIQPCRNCPCPDPQNDRTGLDDCCRDPDLLPSALDWLVAGGESGPGARPMHPDWVRSLRDQCQAAGVPFHFKQHGEWIGVPDLRNLPGGHGPGFGLFDHCPFDLDHEAVRIGKKRAGRELDGRTWDEYPEAT